MPIEIRELVIRAVVAKPADTRDRAEKPGPGAREVAAGGTDEIVQACVREVLRILKRAEEP